MRVLILTDESFAARERSLISRLEVGLADDGVRVVHGVPRKAARWHNSEVFAQTLQYEGRGQIVSRPWRVRQALSALEELADSSDRPADVVHCFGQGCWAFGAELAGLIGAGLAFELWCAELVGRGTSVTRRRAGGERHAPIYFVSDSALERAVRTQDPNLPVRLTPWGVHTPPQAFSILGDGKTISVMIAGSGRDPVSYSAALEGLAAVAARHPEILIFADEIPFAAARVWPEARRLGLLSRLTLIPDMEARRDLALRGDILLLPECRGEQRSLTLDAMAHGMLILAAGDPLSSALIDGRTARTVDKPTSDRWSAAIGWALDAREQAKALAWGGREHIRLQRRASAHVASVVDSYEWLSAGEAIPFAAR
jgi:hypothetical protein